MGRLRPARRSCQIPVQGMCPSSKGPTGKSQTAPLGVGVEKPQDVMVGRLGVEHTRLELGVARVGVGAVGVGDDGEDAGRLQVPGLEVGAGVDGKGGVTALARLVASGLLADVAALVARAVEVSDAAKVAQAAVLDAKDLSSVVAAREEVGDLEEASKIVLGASATVGHRQQAAIHPFAVANSCVCARCSGRRAWLFHPYKAS
jgi:hypothetical protein